MKHICKAFKREAPQLLPAVALFNIPFLKYMCRTIGTTITEHDSFSSAFWKYICHTIVLAKNATEAGDHKGIWRGNRGCAIILM
jgi:hypothetical protein